MFSLAFFGLHHTNVGLCNVGYSCEGVWTTMTGTVGWVLWKPLSVHITVTSLGPLVLMVPQPQWWCSYWSESSELLSLPMLIIYDGDRAFACEYASLLYASCEIISWVLIQIWGSSVQNKTSCGFYSSCDCFLLRKLWYILRQRPTVSSQKSSSCQSFTMFFSRRSTLKCLHFFFFNFVILYWGCMIHSKLRVVRTCWLMPLLGLWSDLFQ